VVPHGTLAERSGVQPSLRGCYGETPRARLGDAATGPAQKSNGCPGGSATGPGERPTSSFDAQHLLELSDDLHEVGLLVHHGMDVFISLRNLIHDAVIFAAFDAGGLLA
jgi:hypothetical protein